MKPLELFLSRRRMVLMAALLLSLMGWVAWTFMPRQEDPDMPDLWGNVVTSFPGTDAETVERLILEPLEDHLAGIEEIREINATAMAELALIDIELEATVPDVDKVWDDVAEVIAEAYREFPVGAGEPALNADLNDQESVVLALTGGNDPLSLTRAAKAIKDDLLTLPSVGEVKLVADPGEQITITLDESAARRLNLTLPGLAAILQARNVILPGGSIKMGGQTVSLRPQTEFTSLEEIRQTPVSLPSGATVPLSEVAQVRQGPAEPALNIMRYNGEMSVGLGIVARDGVHLVAFGAEVRARVREIQPQYLPVQIHEMEFQPDRVQTRLSSLGQSLLLGIFIVAAVLLFAMGPRLGLVVAVVVPLVALASLGVFAASGGVLHQISIAALVIALGMLVDNAIVVAENVQWRIENGEPRRAAALNSVRELAAPLGSATATTLAVFVPMLIAEGTTAMFTRALPIVIMLTLTISYLYAIFVTPILSSMFLRAKKKSVPGFMDKLSQKIGRLALKRAPLVLLSAVLLVAASVVASGWVKQQFFPSSDRNQLMISVRLPEGSHLSNTDQTAQKLERLLLARSEVASVTSFIGRSVPHFYYNLEQIPWSPHYAQLVVNTAGYAEVGPLLDLVRQFSRDDLAHAEVIPARLEQGPPVKTPVEVRLYGQDLAKLNEAADAVLSQVRQVNGTVDARHDLSMGAPAVRFVINDAAAARYGVSRPDIATALYGQTRGLPVGQYRAQDDPVPVLLRAPAGEHYPVQELESLTVAGTGGQTVPLAQVAQMDLEWRPAAIRHRNRVRVVSVSSHLEEGSTYSDVQPALETKLATLTMPQGVRLDFGGQAEGSAEANQSMMVALPWGLLLLFAILLAEFNSFRKVGIILTTVPLAAAGVVPGLILGNEPFGFMSFLGVIALVGVVVNNAIVLLDVIETRLGEGSTLHDAIAAAVARRTRPILLTTATTVAGLLPLALSNTTFWPPLAWAMISGLLASTLLTLMVIPALYAMLFGGGPKIFQRKKMRPAIMGTAVLLLAGLIGTPVLRAGEPPAVTLEQALQKAIQRPAAHAARLRAQSSDYLARAQFRDAVMPVVHVEGAANFRDRTIGVDSPTGPVQFGEDKSLTGTAAVVQPLLRPSRLFYTVPAARQDALAGHQHLRATELRLAGLAADVFVKVLSLDAELTATDAFIRALEERLRESEARVKAGRALETDSLKVKLELDAARQDRLSLEQSRDVAALQLGHSIGESGPVEPVLPRGFQVAPLAFDTAMKQAMAFRPELKQLQTRIKAEHLRSKAIGAEAWPELESRVSYSWAQDEPFRDGSFVEGALQFSWQPFAAGTRAPRKAAARVRVKALEAEWEEVRRLVTLELKTSLAEIETARGALDVASRGVGLAQETLRVERQRHANGRATVNDLLSAEAAVRNQQTRLAKAKFQWVRANVLLILRTGKIGASG